MKKLLVIMLSILLVTSFVGCKKKPADTTANGETKTTEQKGSTETKAATDFAYYPADAMVIGEVDVKSLMNLKGIKEVLDKELPKIEQELGIKFDKVATASFYMNVKNINETPSGAVVVNELDFSSLKAKAQKTEQVEGVDVFHMDSESGFSIIDKDTIIGTIDALKSMVALKKGKGENLASTQNSAVFKETMGKLGNSVLKMSFVPNAVVQAELKKAAEMQPMFAGFINNFKAASFGLGVDEKNLYVYINAKSEKQAVADLVKMANDQITAMGGEIEKQLKALEPMLGADGVTMLTDAFKSLKITADGEYALISITISAKLVEKAPSLVPMLLMGGMMGGSMEKPVEEKVEDTKVEEKVEEKK